MRMVRLTHTEMPQATTPYVRAVTRKALCAAGLAAFVLSLCWQLPQTLLMMTGLGWASPAVWPYLLADAGLCCIGGMGAACAKSCADGQT